MISISYRLTEDNAVDVRCELKISGGAVNSAKYKAVSSVDIFDDKPVTPDSFALTLYYASQGESMWNIAKKHNTGLELLMSENELEDAVLGSDRMLLIPKL